MLLPYQIRHHPRLDPFMLLLLLIVHHLIAAHYHTQYTYYIFQLPTHNVQPVQIPFTFQHILHKLTVIFLPQMLIHLNYPLHHRIVKLIDLFKLLFIPHFSFLVTVMDIQLLNIHVLKCVNLFIFVLLLYDPQIALYLLDFVIQRIFVHVF